MNFLRVKISSEILEMVNNVRTKKIVYCKINWSIEPNLHERCLMKKKTLCCADISSSSIELHNER